MRDESRLRRGLVLQALHAQYPYPLTEAALSRQISVIYLGDERARARDVAYLEEKGFLQVERATVGAVTLRTFKITTAGVDVVEGSTKDAGVELAQ